MYALEMFWSFDNTYDKNNKLILSTNISIKLTNLKSVISILSLCVLIAGSTLAIGCLSGFVFAIPKSISNPNATNINLSKGYISNDNLVQVSDWLTKIIVGVGLTQLTHIPQYMQSIGHYVGMSLGGEVTGEVAAISIIVYFLICGFLLSYLWTRLYFARMLEDAEIVQQNVSITTITPPTESTNK
jgi:hypothetical protein